MILGSSILGYPYVLSPNAVLVGQTVPGGFGVGNVVLPTTGQVQKNVNFGVMNQSIGTFTGSGGGGNFPLGG